jgi:hypothetical protein
MTAMYFLPGAMPEKAPEIPRRRNFVLMITGAAFGLGVAGLVIYGSSRPAPLQRPGPRRFPPGYRP